MPLASTASVAVRYILESAFGVTPGTGNSDNVRFTGESLAYNISKSESGEIRSDRQTTDLIPTGADANGGINFEMIYKEFDDFLEAALMGTYSVYGAAGIGTSFTPTFTATTITAGAAPTGSSAFTTLAKGQWFKLNAAGSTNDGKAFRVSGSVSPTTTVITVDAATPLAVSAAAAATISSSRLTNASTERSFSIERMMGDITQFFVYRGMTLNKMNLKFASGAITTGSFEFIGKDGARNTATFMPGSPAASVTTNVMNGVAGISRILEGGSVLANTFVTSLDITIENNLRGRPALGVLGNCSVGVGSFKVTGTLEIYMADGSLFDKFISNASTSIQVVTMDDANNGYAIQLPNMKYGDYKFNAGGKDQDIKASIPFSGILDATTGKTMLIDRFGA